MIISAACASNTLMTVAKHRSEELVGHQFSMLIIIGGLPSTPEQGMVPEGCVLIVFERYVPG